jgi:hypothetical protein
MDFLNLRLACSKDMVRRKRKLDKWQTDITDRNCEKGEVSLRKSGEGESVLIMSHT